MGFDQGTLSTSHPVNITLGRMAARLDIVIKAADSESTLSNLRLQLKNAVIKSHYSPMKVGSEENIYVDFPEDNTFKDKEVTSSSPNHLLLFYRRKYHTGKRKRDSTYCKS